MAQMSIFTCDKCGDSETYSGLSPERLQPVAIGLYVNFGSFHSVVNTSNTPAAAQVWCSTCVMKYGILELNNEGDKAVTLVNWPTPTDLLVNALEQLGFRRNK